MPWAATFFLITFRLGLKALSINFVWRIAGKVFSGKQFPPYINCNTHRGEKQDPVRVTYGKEKKRVKTISNESSVTHELNIVIQGELMRMRA